MCRGKGDAKGERDGDGDSLSGVLGYPIALRGRKECREIFFFFLSN